MNNISFNVKNFYENVPSISETKKYWLIRTQSGELFDIFYNNNFVAIGYNEIAFETVYKISQDFPKENDAIKNLKKIVTKIYDEDKRPGYIANQIYNFTFNVKKGDLVIIPSEESKKVAFGVVEETPLVKYDKETIDDCPHHRRKKIRWLKTVKRHQLEPLLLRMFFSHNAVNDVTKYGNLIESTLKNYFIRDGEEHIVLKIERNENIGALDLFQLGYYLLNFTEVFFRKNNLDLDINDFDVKVNLNSKGSLKFISKYGKGGFILALITVALNGGGGEFSYGDAKIDISTDGLIQKIIDYQNNEFDREMVSKIFDSMDSLKVEKPEDALELYRQFSVNKKKD